MKNPIICAIDKPDLEQSNQLINNIKNDVGAIKLGLEFFCSQGPAGVKKVKENNIDIFLDLKLHDIPNTVAKAARQVAELGVFMTTIHTLGGAEMMKAAKYEIAECENKPLLIGVTILTSHHDISEIGVDFTIRDQVLKLAELAATSGLDGVVCSPHEIADIKKNFGNDLKLIVPGIRGKHDKKNDQARTMSPNEAVTLGADYLVIGRPITAAENPPSAAKTILDSIS